MKFIDLAVEAVAHGFLFGVGTVAGLTHDALLPNEYINALFEGTLIYGIGHLLDYATGWEIKYTKLQYIPSISAGIYVGHYLRNSFL